MSVQGGGVGWFGWDYRPDPAINFGKSAVVIATAFASAHAVNFSRGRDRKPVKTLQYIYIYGIVSNILQLTLPEYDLWRFSS